MPVPRNRKKKAIKSASFTKHQILSLIPNSCWQCSGPRQGLSPQQLPPHQQIEWDSEIEEGGIEHFLYCPKCDSASLISKPVWSK